MKKYKIYRQYDGQKEKQYSTHDYSFKDTEELFDAIKTTIKITGGKIVGETSDGFYARTCNKSLPFIFRRKAI